MKKVVFVIFACFAVVKTIAQTGIGTTMPVNKFQIETTTADPLTSGNNLKNGHFRLSGTSVTHLLDIGLMSSTSNFGTWIQARKKDDYSINYNLYLNPNGGNVGIGTTTPTAKLNIAGGGVRIHNGFSNTTIRPVINTSTVGSYEIRGVGSEAGTTQRDGGDDGFLRLSAGGGTSSNTQASIDISGYSTVADMNNSIVIRTAGVERVRVDNLGKTTLNGNFVGGNATSSTISGFAANMNEQTGVSYDLTALDNGKIITLNNASAITLNVPVLFKGFNCMIIQLGLGQVTLTQSGTTIMNRSGFTKTGGKNAIVSLVAIADNSFISSGDMSN